MGIMGIDEVTSWQQFDHQEVPDYLSTFTSIFAHEALAAYDFYQNSSHVYHPMLLR